MEFAVDNYKSKGRKRQHVTEKRNHRQHTPTNNASDAPKKHRINHRAMGAHNHLQRQNDRGSAIDQINHKAQDFTVTDKLCRKTIADRYRDHYESLGKYNQQNHLEQHTKKDRKKEGISKKVQLPEIYSNLTLGNLTHAQNTFHQYDIIINLSGEHILSRQTWMFSRIRTPRYKVTNNVVNITMPDQRQNATAVQYACFIKRVNAIIKEARKHNQTVLINCFAGTNRSAFLAIAFALLCNTEPNDADYWIKYIEEQKKASKLEYWDTLTNQAFRNILKYKINTLKI